MNDTTGFEREARRQQWLLRVLWRDANATPDAAWLRDPPARLQRGLQAYRAHAGASAERALAIAYPTVAALVGEASFAALARDFWRHQAPARGDLGEWGAALPDFVATSEALAGEPYLADSARLDWCVHLASRAADAVDAPPPLEALGTHAPEALCLRLRPGCALVESAWPVATLWLAHQGRGDDRFATARAAFTARRGEQAWVWRDGFVVHVDALDVGAAAFSRAVLGGATLAQALDAAGDAFAFDRWLVQALQQRWLVEVQALPTPASP